jgi:hypothetical protein
MGPLGGKRVGKEPVLRSFVGILNTNRQNVGIQIVCMYVHTQIQNVDVTYVHTKPDKTKLKLTKPNLCRPNLTPLGAPNPWGVCHEGPYQ